MSERGNQIRIENLTHRYTPKSPLTFEGINISAEPGESLVIIGRSGCGKSTLLHMIAGLLHGYTGDLKIDGKDVVEPSPRWVMMFQAPHLFPWMTVERNVGIGLHFAGWSEDKKKDRVEEAIGLVHLDDFKKSQHQRSIGRSTATCSISSFVGYGTRNAVIRRTFLRT